MLKDEIKQICDNAKNDAKHDGIQFYGKIKLHPLRCLILILFFIVIFLLVLWTLIELPHWQVSHFDINNASQEATIENQYRATIAQILGGSAVIIGIYFAWGNLTTAREGQITERFTRAVEQLGATDQNGNKKVEIRLGGIYALERISKESEEDHWPIMEILTAYVRQNSSAQIFRNKIITHQAMGIQANESTTNEVPEVSKVPLDIQAILTVIGRRVKSFENGKPNYLDLQETNLERASLEDAHLEGADLSRAHLEKANLFRTHLERASFEDAHLEGADLKWAHLERASLEGAYLEGAHLEGADLFGTCLKGAYLKEAHLEGAELFGASLEGAFLEGASLEGAEDLSIDQLSEAKTLYNVELEEELLIKLKTIFPTLFEQPNEYEFYNFLI